MTTVPVAMGPNLQHVGRTDNFKLQREREGEKEREGGRGRGREGGRE